MQSYTLITENGLIIKCILSTKTVQVLKNEYDVRLKKCSNKTENLKWFLVCGK